MAKKTLRPYQTQDAEKLSQFKTCGNLSQPRTGKTPTSLILSDKWPGRRTLIVCTGSMLYKWKQEFEEWLSKPCQVYAGTPKQREEALKNASDGLVITYDTLKLIKRKESVTGAIHAIRKWKPDKMIVDEFHKAKGWDTARAKALNLLAKDVKYRCILTGTPAYSDQLDVYNMLKFLWPEQEDFSTWWKFRQKYVKHTKQWIKQRGIATQIDVPIALNSAGIKLVHALFEKYCVQRKRNDPEVMPWLPKDPIPEIIRLPLAKDQAKALKDLADWFETEDEAVIAKNGLDRITKYRQILSEPRILLPFKTYGPKTNWVLDYMKEYTETSTIYFTNSTKHITLLLPLMQKIAPTECIIGSTPMLERKNIEDRFQSGKTKHLICNTQAAQEGLTLDLAECIVFIEQFPPVGSIDQASQRFTPTVPERADIPKRIIKLIMLKSYDEVINHLIDSRQDNVNVLNDFQTYIKKR